MSANTPKICIILRTPVPANRFSSRSSFTLPEHWVPFLCRHFHIGMRTPCHGVLLENVSDREICRKFLLRKGNRFRISVKEKRRTLFPVVSREISRTANIWIYCCMWPRVARSGRRKRPLETGVAMLYKPIYKPKKTSRLLLDEKWSIMELSYPSSLAAQHTTPTQGTPLTTLK